MLAVDAANAAAAKATAQLATAAAESEALAATAEAATAAAAAATTAAAAVITPAECHTCTSTAAKMSQIKSVGRALEKENSDLAAQYEKIYEVRISGGRLHVIYLFVPINSYFFSLNVL
jgi:hypothetical protein